MSSADHDTDDDDDRRSLGDGTGDGKPDNPEEEEEEEARASRPADVGVGIEVCAASPRVCFCARVWPAVDGLDPISLSAELPPFATPSWPRLLPAEGEGVVPARAWAGEAAVLDVKADVEVEVEGFAEALVPSSSPPFS